MGAALNLVFTIAGQTPVNIGQTTVLPTADNGNANLIIAQPITLSVAATIQSLSFYVTTTGGQLRLALYSDASGYPGTLQAQTAAFTPVAGWNTQPTLTMPSLAAGNYWLVYLPQSNSLGFVSGVVNSTSYWVSFAFASMPTTFPSKTATGAGNAKVQWSFYGTFLEAPAVLASASMIISPSSVVIGNAATITVTARDSNGNPYPGATVALSESGTGDTFNPVSGTTNASGVFTATVVPSVVQSETITAKVIGGQVTVYSSEPMTAVVAPPADAPNYPTLLSNTATYPGVNFRPPWQVAGVDYYVGCPSATVFKDPSTQGPAGTSYGVSGNIRNLTINSNNVVLNGFDFSLHSGIGLVIAANSCTVENCKFVNGTYGGTYQIDNIGVNNVIQNCTVDGGGGTNTFQSSLIAHEGAGLLTLQNNWFKNFPQQVIEIIESGSNYSILYQYNLIDEGGLYTAVAHLNYLQLTGNTGTCTGVTVQYNTGKQTISVGGEGWQFYSGGPNHGDTGGPVNGITCIYNTVYTLPQPGASGSNGVSIATIFHGPEDANYPNSFTPGTISNNYVLFYPLVGGFSQSINNVFYSNTTNGSFDGFTASGNIDMYNGKTVNLDNTET